MGTVESHVSGGFPCIEYSQIVGHRGAGRLQFDHCIFDQSEDDDNGDLRNRIGNAK